MGYYFNPIDETWVEKHKTPRNRQPRAVSRSRLLIALIEEIERGDSETKLYAGLLARKLVMDDEQLMQTFGEKLAALQTTTTG